MKEKLANPVLEKELKLRFRFFKSVSGMIAYLIALLVFLGGFIFVVTQFGGTGGYMRTDQSFAMFIMLAMIQMALVLFITPGLTAGAISTEREKQTLNMLLMTTQTSFQIVIGKLLSSIAFLALLLLAGLPFYSVVFLYGGISPMQLLTIFFFYFITMIAVGSIGVFFSIVLKRTITAMISTYSVMIVLAGVTAFFFFIGVSVQGLGNYYNTTPNFAPLTYFFASINPGALVLTVVSPDLQTGLGELTGIKVAVWIPYLLFYSLVTAVMVWLSTNKLRVNMKRG